jgi:hypothetical protein
MLTRLDITGLLVAGTPAPSAFPNGTNGNNINAVPAVPTNFKKSRRDINLTFVISLNNSSFKYKNL